MKNTKIVKIGKFARYALIVEVLDRETDKNINDTITYINNDNLDTIIKKYHELLEYDNDKPFYYDIDIYDYEEASYIREV